MGMIVFLKRRIRFKKRYPYKTAHPETTWGNLDLYKNPLWLDGYDLCAIKLNGVLVFKRRHWIVKMMRKVFG